MAARCETVLNTTMAEFETYHTQKVEDFETLTTEYLDGEIALYEQVSFVLPSPPATACRGSCHAPPGPRKAESSPSDVPPTNIRLARRRSPPTIDI